MASFFFDSSALVKRYISEIGSSWVMQISGPSSNNQIFIAAITGVEVTSAIARQGKSGYFSPQALASALTQFCYDFSKEYKIIYITPSVIHQAMDIAQNYALRGYDAVQLTAAIEITNQRRVLQLPYITFVSADNALNAAAKTEGFVVDNPNHHP